MAHKLEMTNLVKKDGRITLEPRYREPDTFETKLKHAKGVLFRVKIDDAQLSTVSIRVELRSFEEVNMAIKYNSLLKNENPQIKHFEIPFTACFSTENDPPCTFKGDQFQRYADSDTVVYKVSRYYKERNFLHVKLDVKQDCLLKATASATFHNSDQHHHRMSVVSRPASVQKTFRLGNYEVRQLSFEPGH